MERIAHKTEQETISMHVVTFVTLAFLPGTFVAVSLLRCFSRSPTGLTSLFSHQGFLPKWTRRDQQSFRRRPWICGVLYRSVQTFLSYLLPSYVYYLRFMVHGVQDIGPEGSQERDGRERVIRHLALYYHHLFIPLNPHICALRGE